MGASRGRSVRSFRARPDHGQERVRKRPGNCCHRRKDSCSPLSPCDSGEKTATHCPDRRAATAILGIGTGGPSPKKRRPAPVPRPRIVVMDSLSGLRGGGLFSSPHTSFPVASWNRFRLSDSQAFVKLTLANRSLRTQVHGKMRVRRQTRPS